MLEYLNVLAELKNCVEKDTRTGVPTVGKFFNHIEFDIEKNGFPLITTKQMAIKGVLGELLRFISGSANNADFVAAKCYVWDDNANHHTVDDDGHIIKRNVWIDSPFRKGYNDLGRIYGVQWRNWDHTFYLSYDELEDFAKRNITKQETGGLNLSAVVEYIEGLGYEYMGQLSRNGKPCRYVFRRQIDQLAYVINELKTNPLNRRLIISAWNPGDFDKMALPPCHCFHHWQCEPLTYQERIQYADDDRVSEMWMVPDELRDARLDELGVPKYRLNLMTYIRSNDWGIGACFNIASYAAFMVIMARITGHVIGKMHYVTGDTHLYKNHFAGAEEQLGREPFTNHVELKIAEHLKTLEDFEKASPDDFTVVNYTCHPKLVNKMPMNI